MYEGWAILGIPPNHRRDSTRSRSPTTWLQKHLSGRCLISIVFIYYTVNKYKIYPPMCVPYYWQLRGRHRQDQCWHCVWPRQLLVSMVTTTHHNTNQSSPVYKLHLLTHDKRTIDWIDTILVGMFKWILCISLYPWKLIPPLLKRESYNKLLVLIQKLY